MQCPKCQAEMNEKLSSKVSANPCPRCKGIWFSRESLDSFITQHGPPNPSVIDPIFYYKGESKKTKLHCPSCSLHYLDLRSIEHFEYEQCPNCLGLFLDEDEIAPLLDSPRRETPIGHDIGIVSSWGLIEFLGSLLD